jgi:RNA polymerase sigma factor for flagellar operon FliA
MKEEEGASASREERIRVFFPLVRRMAKRVRRIVAGASFDDLVGDGCIGLIRAVDTYDVMRGVVFERYAGKVILGTMLNGLRRMDPIPERVRRCVRRAQEQRYRLALECGTLLTLGEMERRPGGSGLRYARTVAFRYSSLSLESVSDVNERVLSDGRSDPAVQVIDAFARREVLRAIALLPERQRRVVLLHYYRNVSLHAISSGLQVTPQRVSQIHLRALSHLRTRMSAT